MSELLNTASTPVSAEEIEEGVRSLNERGFYVVERSLTEEQAAEKACILDELIESGQAQSMQDFGYHVSPACNYDARLCDMYAEPRVIAIAEALFGAEARITSSGSRISDQSNMPRLTWHTHPYTAEEEPNEANPIRQGKKITHLVYGWYMEGCSPESGPLIVLPRRFDDEVNRPLGPANEAWEGEVLVNCPPGSCVLFTTDLWHAALAGTSEKRRHLSGGHLQSVEDTRPHREDVVHEGPAVEEAVSRNPEFARLIGR